MAFSRRFYFISKVGTVFIGEAVNSVSLVDIYDRRRIPVAVGGKKPRIHIGQRMLDKLIPISGLRM